MWDIQSNTIQPQPQPAPPLFPSEPAAFHFQVAAAVYFPYYHCPCQNQTHLKGKNSNLGRQLVKGNLNQGSDEVRDKIKFLTARR